MAPEERAAYHHRIPISSDHRLTEERQALDPAPDKYVTRLTRHPTALDVWHPSRTEKGYQSRVPTNVAQGMKSRKSVARRCPMPKKYLKKPTDGRMMIQDMYLIRHIRDTGHMLEVKKIPYTTDLVKAHPPAAEEDTKKRATLTVRTSKDKVWSVKHCAGVSAIDERSDRKFKLRYIYIFICIFV